MKKQTINLVHLHKPAVHLKGSGVQSPANVQIDILHRHFQSVEDTYGTPLQAMCLVHGELPLLVVTYVGQCPFACLTRLHSVADVEHFTLRPVTHIYTYYLEQRR